MVTSSACEKRIGEGRDLPNVGSAPPLQRHFTTLYSSKIPGGERASNFREAVEPWVASLVKLSLTPR